MKTKLALALMGAALISLPAAAQTTRPADQAPKAAQQNAAASGPLYELKAGQWRATKLTGLSVYNTNNEKVGDINEMIAGRDGKITAVVIGVGGFLGMGEHLVAVPFEQVKWIDEPVERTVSTTRAPTGTTGSGTSAPATNVDRPAAAPTTTTVDRQGDTVTTTTDRPATADRPTTTTTTVDRPATGMSDRSAARDAYRGYPDHAVVAMTKEQLKALPEVKYAR